MDSVGDVLAAARDRDGVAFDAPGRTTGHSFREFVTSSWKAGNLLRQYGVHAGAEVAVVVGPRAPEAADEPGRLGATPDPLFAALGALSLGATVDFAPDRAVGATALIAPAAWPARYETAPGTTRLAYGDQPESADVVGFERQRWSENPVEPPDRATADALAGGGHRQGDLVERARRVVRDGLVGGGDRVRLGARLDPDTFAAGVLAPLAAGATIVGGEPSAVDVEVGPGGEIMRRG